MLNFHRSNQNHCPRDDVFPIYGLLDILSTHILCVAHSNYSFIFAVTQINEFKFMFNFQFMLCLNVRRDFSSLFPEELYQFSRILFIIKQNTHRKIGWF